MANYDFEEFQTRLKAAEDRLRPLGRRGWEARREEVHRSIAQLENYTRLSKSQQEELDDLSFEQQAVESRSPPRRSTGTARSRPSRPRSATAPPTSRAAPLVCRTAPGPGARRSRTTPTPGSGSRKDAERVVVEQHGSLGNLVRSMSTTSGSAIVPTFDNVTLDSKTMSALVVGSLEWFQDAPNAWQVVEQAIAAAVATQLGLVCLFGGVTTGNEGISLATPPNPRGILAILLAQASSSVLGAAANGTTQTALSFYNEVIDTIYFPMTFNEMPNALIWNAKLAQQYAKAYDSQGQPLQAPAAVAEVEKFVSNQVPSFTSGTMTSRATDLFVDDFRQLLVGQRLTFTVQTLTERYAELGQIGIVAHWRGDVQLARARAFAVYRYL